MQTATEVRRAGPRVRIKNWTQRDALLLVGCAYAGIAFAWLLFRVTPLEGVFGFVVCAYLAFVAIYWFVVRDVEGPLLASDRVVSVIVASAAGFVLVPLVLIIGFVIVQGAKALTPGFFVHTLETVGPLDPATAGGGLHAIVGTFMQVGAAMIISVPLGLMVAIYLNEIGGRPARPVRFVVDAMSGVPSIVAGLFSYALIRSPQQSQIDRAWTGALVLIAIVLGLFTLARVLGNRAGKGRGRRLRKRGAKT